MAETVGGLFSGALVVSPAIEKRGSTDLEATLTKVSRRVIFERGG